MSDIKKLNSDNFNEAIKNGVTLVDFWAPWCGPCKMQLPILEQVKNALDKKADIAKLNIDNSQDIASDYGVMSIPTLILFKNGKEKKRFVGLQDKNTLLNALKNA